VSFSDPNPHIVGSESNDRMVNNQRLVDAGGIGSQDHTAVRYHNMHSQGNSLAIAEAEAFYNRSGGVVVGNAGGGGYPQPSSTYSASGTSYRQSSSSSQDSDGTIGGIFLGGIFLCALYVLAQQAYAWVLANQIEAWGAGLALGTLIVVGTIGATAGAIAVSVVATVGFVVAAYVLDQWPALENAVLPPAGVCLFAAVIAIPIVLFRILAWGPIYKSLRFSVGLMLGLLATIAIGLIAAYLVAPEWTNERVTSAAIALHRKSAETPVRVPAVLPRPQQQQSPKRHAQRQQAAAPTAVPAPPVATPATEATVVPETATIAPATVDPNQLEGPPASFGSG
jgi:hypothetical protein